MKRILVTGGGGYIGACVVELLINKGYFPVVLDTFYWGKKSLEPYGDKIKLIEGDIRSSKDVIYALQDIDAVIHLAGIVGQPACTKNRLAHFTTNVDSTNTLVDCMTHPDVPFIRDLVYCSSCSVYGNVSGMHDEVTETTFPLPLSEYADAKLKAEKIINKKAVEVPQFTPTILRLTTIFGWSPRPRMDLVTNLFVHRAITDGEIKIYGDGSQYRSLIHVRDVASALVHTLESPSYLRDRQIFHVGEETNNVTVKQLAEFVKKYVPGTKINYMGEAETDRRDYRINCQKIKNTLNWQAKYSVSDGIKEMAENIQSTELDLTDKIYRNDSYDYM